MVARPLDIHFLWIAPFFEFTSDIKYMAYTLSLNDQLNESDPDAVFIVAQLAAYNRQYAPADQHRLFNILLRDEQGQLAGGLLAETYWGWLGIKILWLSEDARRQGWGSRMMRAAEAEGLRRGCHHAQVDTMSFQAPEFYLKLGYEVWGVLDDLPTGHSRIFYKKKLS